MDNRIGEVGHGILKFWAQRGDSPQTLTWASDLEIGHCKSVSEEAPWYWSHHEPKSAVIIVAERDPSETNLTIPIWFVLMLLVTSTWAFYESSRYAVRFGRIAWGLAVTLAILTLLPLFIDSGRWISIKIEFVGWKLSTRGENGWIYLGRERIERPKTDEVTSLSRDERQRVTLKRIADNFTDRIRIPKALVVMTDRRGGGWVAMSQWIAMVACGMPAAFLGIRKLVKWNGKKQPGHCKHCDYDLRATPDRCPECGRPSSSGP